MRKFSEIFYKKTIDLNLFCTDSISLWELAHNYENKIVLRVGFFPQ